MNKIVITNADVGRKVFCKAFGFGTIIAVNLNIYDNWDRVTVKFDDANRIGSYTRTFATDGSYTSHPAYISDYQLEYAYDEASNPESSEASMIELKAKAFDFLIKMLIDQSVSVGEYLKVINEPSEAYNHFDVKGNSFITTVEAVKQTSKNATESVTIMQARIVWPECIGSLTEYLLKQVSEDTNYEHSIKSE